VAVAVLFPLSNDQAGGNDRKIRWDEHAEGILIGFILAGKELDGFRQFRALGVGIAIDSGFEFAAAMQDDFRRSMTGADYLGLERYGAGLEAIDVPDSAECCGFKSIVDVDVGAGSLGPFSEGEECGEAGGEGDGEEGYAAAGLGWEMA
jgi:hypothetical protein